MFPTKTRQVQFSSSVLADDVTKFRTGKAADGVGHEALVGSFIFPVIGTIYVGLTSQGCTGKGKYTSLAAVRKWTQVYRHSRKKLKSGPGWLS